MYSSLKARPAMIPDHMNAVLDEIFASYMQVKPQHSGKFDREFRDPCVLMGTAQQLGLIPAADRIIRVTGSKGKGSTSRLVARYLAQLYPGAKIGLLVSPEELAHTDRMQINGQPISETGFIQHYQRLRPVLQQTLKALPEGGYLSPSGLFLLIALSWFKAQAVDHFVLETGRGVLADEVGHIPSRVGVVTSILLEHPGNLGPTLDDIARDKLSIAVNASLLCCLPELAERFKACLPEGVRPAALAPYGADTSVPAWLCVNDQLARSAVCAYANMALDQMPALPGGLSSPSFGWTEYHGCRIAFEALVSAGSADPALFDTQFKNRHVLALVSLPDDKDRDGIFALLDASGCQIHEVALTGTRGYLHYEKANAGGHSMTQMAFNDPASLRRLIDHLLADKCPDILYIVGTHTYVRLFKLAMQG